jgi:ketosteroid isomerase-like protein
MEEAGSTPGSLALAAHAPERDTAQPMSQENVELVRSTIEAHNAGGEWLDFVAEDVEIHPDASRWPDAKPFRGREEYRRFDADIDKDFEGGAKLEIKEIFATGDRVVARTDWGGRGRASGIDLRVDLTTIFTVRDGRIAKIEFFFDHAQALEAAGLRE